VVLKKCGLIALVAAATAACGSDGSLSADGQAGLPTSPSQVAPAPGNVEVSRVRVFVKDGRPQAYVEGTLGDGCTRLLPVTQQRAGSTFHISLSSVREGEVCTMILQLVNEWVPLEGLAAPGTYQVRANAATVAFELVADGDGQLRIEPDPGPLPTVPTTEIPGHVAPNDPPRGGDDSSGQVQPAVPGGDSNR